MKDIKKQKSNNNIFFANGLNSNRRNIKVKPPERSILILLLLIGLIVILSPAIDKFNGDVDLK